MDRRFTVVTVDRDAIRIEARNMHVLDSGVLVFYDNQGRIVRAFGRNSWMQSFEGEGGIVA